MNKMPHNVSIFVFYTHCTLQQQLQREHKSCRCDFVFWWLQNGKVIDLNLSLRRSIRCILRFFVLGVGLSSQNRREAGGIGFRFFDRCPTLSGFSPFKNLNLECTIFLLSPFLFGALSKDKEREKPTSSLLSDIARIQSLLRQITALLLQPRNPVNRFLNAKFSTVVEIKVK